jgi:hypothetical protein
MSYADSYLTALAAHYAEIADDGLRRLRKAERDVRNRKYTPGKLLSDVLGFWMDGAFGCWAALSAGRVGGVPEVLFVLPKGKAGDSRDIPVYVPGTKQPDFTDIEVSGSPSTPLSEDNIQVAITNERDVLKIALVKLHPVSKGTYRTLIYVDQLPLAFLYVRIV